MSPNVFDKIEEKRQKSEENDDGDEEVVSNSDQRQYRSTYAHWQDEYRKIKPTDRRLDQE